MEELQWLAVDRYVETAHSSVTSRLKSAWLTTVPVKRHTLGEALLKLSRL